MTQEEEDRWIAEDLPRLVAGLDPIDSKVGPADMEEIAGVAANLSGFTADLVAPVRPLISGDRPPEFYAGMLAAFSIVEILDFRTYGEEDSDGPNMVRTVLASLAARAMLRRSAESN